MNRRAFVGSTASIMLLGLMPASTRTLYAQELTFRLTDDENGLAVSQDRGRSFEHALTLPVGYVMSVPEAADGEFYARISQRGGEYPFSLRSENGLIWKNH